MAENVDDILEIHANDSDESFDVNNCNEVNLFSGKAQFSVFQVLTRSGATTATSASGKPQMETENIINIENSRKKPKAPKRKNVNDKSASLSKIPKRNIMKKTVYNNSDIIKI